MRFVKARKKYLKGGRMQEFVLLVKSIPMWVSVLGSMLMFVSFAILITQNGKLGKLKPLIEVCAGVGGVLSSPIAFLTLFG